MRNPMQATGSAFNKFICLYLPASDPPALTNWYKEHFHSHETRKNSIYWGRTKEQGVTCNFMTDEYIPGQPYEMFAVRFETDCIEAVYERLSQAGVPLEPMLTDQEGTTFVFTDPQGNKFQVRQHADTETQPLQDDVPAFIGVSALFFPAIDPEATRKWYSEIVGLESNAAGWPITRNGEEISFYRSVIPGKTTNFDRNAILGDRPSTLYSIINVAVDDLAEMHKRMLDQGQKVEGISDRGGCGRQFQLYDPDGNMLDIWEPQTMVRKNFNIDRGDPDWRNQYAMINASLPPERDMDSFLSNVEENDLIHRRIVIPGYNLLQKIDPEGLESLLEALRQFGLEHPQYAFDIIRRDWDANEPSGPVTKEQVPDPRKIFIPYTERAEGVINIYGRPNQRNNPNWKERMVLRIPFFEFNIDTFFAYALKGCHELFHRVRIVHDEASIPWFLSEIDPDAVRELKLAVEQFNHLHPECAIQLIE